MPRFLTPLICVLVLTGLAACDFKFPLTSPDRAKVDVQLIGNWNTVSVSTEAGGKDWIFAVGRVSDVDSTKRQRAPKGAMTFESISYRHPSFSPKQPVVFWPTIIGSSRYLNGCADSDLIKKGTVSGNAYVIFKYEIKADTLTVYKQSKKSLDAMKQRLGKEYSSADLRQEMARPDVTDWNFHFRATRIK